MWKRPSQPPSSPPTTITQQNLSPPPPCRELAFVPFSWEEKPGVPKTQENTLLVSIHIPAPVHSPLHPTSAIPPCALSKTPSLQSQNDATALHKTASFSTLRPPPAAHRRPTSGLLVRKQSFESIIYGNEVCRGLPLTRRYSHGSLIVPGAAQRKRSLQGRKEDDPFLMAIQACRKEPIRVLYNSERRTKEELCKAYHDRMEEKHLTIRQLFTQQPQEEERTPSKLAQKQPLIVKKKKHANTFFARCLGCY